MKSLRLLANQIRNKIYDKCFKEEARKTPKDFTRDRKMSFEELIIHMLTAFKCSTASSLRRFFINLCVSVGMTQQALSEARKKVKVEAFVILFEVSVNALTTCTEKNWNGYRVYAIDGSKIALPTDKKLLEYYGALGKDNTAPTGQGSILYDVLNDIIADASIEPMTTDERTLAKKHLLACEKLVPDDKKLIIFDRGYASFEMIEMLESMGFYYVFRVKRGFNKAIDAQTDSDAYVWLKSGDKRIHVRVVKFMLDSGEVETLITNITDDRLGTAEFKKLYFMRWPVETKYDVVKNKLQLENFNTRTVEGIQQDFYATMLLANFAAAAAMDAQADIEEKRKDKDNKYQYKANINEVIGILKDRLVIALSFNSPDIQSAVIDKIEAEITRYVIPVRSNRSIPRNKSPRKAKFFHNQKANC
ncbi:MAG: IS4 family transposase [Eubacterium sp.]|nr:IS4 family transposase [Eubacterium sp.]